MEQGAYAEAEALLQGVARDPAEAARPRERGGRRDAGEPRRAARAMGDWPASETLFRRRSPSTARCSGSDDLALARRSTTWRWCSSSRRSSRRARRSTANPGHPPQAPRQRAPVRRPEPEQHRDALRQAAQAPRRPSRCSRRPWRSTGRRWARHPVVGANLSNLALVDLKTDGLPQAEEYFRQVLELDKKITGEANPPCRRNRVWASSSPASEVRRGRAVPPRGARDEAEGVRRGPLGSCHDEEPARACLTDEGRFAAAEPLLLESRAIIEKQFGPAHDRPGWRRRE